MLLMFALITIVAKSAYYEPLWVYFLVKSPTNIGSRFFWACFYGPVA